MPRTSLLETLLTHPALFALETATAAQRAICRIADGVPLGELAAVPEVLAMIGGCDVERLPDRPPTELYLLAGIRSAKSLFCAVLGFRAALTVDLSGLREGEVPRISILSFDKDKAKVVFRDHLLGSIQRQPALRSMLSGEPTSDTLVLRRPDGRLVEIVVVAGARSGGAMVARWCAGVIFDEAPRMQGQEDGVVNFDDARGAVLGRLLPGAQLIAVGSPWAPRGPMYDAVQEFWGKPCEHLVVLRAPGPVMNPFWWTPARIEALRLSPNGEQSYKTDVLGEFADPESAFFSTEDLKAVTREGPESLPRDGDLQYVAAMDPASRRNAWTLVVVGKRVLPDGVIKLVVVRVRQWLPQKGAPLDPRAVLTDIRAELADYGLNELVTDQWSVDALAAIARELKLSIVEHPMTAPDRVRLYESLRTRVLSRGIELAPDRQMRDDLLSIRKKVTTNSIAIELPVTHDGRHADYAPALVLAAEVAAQSAGWVFAMRRMIDDGGGLFGARR
jgi:hypothetical protein